MLPSPISGIDHPVIAVRDMQEARERYERAGFTVPPRGSHKEWGTGNWCIMFGEDYLELRGIVDRSRYTHRLDEFLEHREGLMGVAFASPLDVDEARLTLGTRGLHPPPVRHLTRRFELPEGEVEPSFKLLFFDTSETGPLLASLICQHLTPQLLRKPEFLRHANGVQGITSMTAVASDLEAATNTLSRYFGEERLRRTDAAVNVDIRADQCFRVVSPQEASRLGVSLDVRPPYLAAISLRTGSIAKCEAAWARGSLRPTRIAANALRLEPDSVCGVSLDFVEA